MSASCAPVPRMAAPATRAAAATRRRTVCPMRRRTVRPMRRPVTLARADESHWSCTETLLRGHPALRGWIGDSEVRENTPHLDQAGDGWAFRFRVFPGWRLGSAHEPGRFLR